MRVGNLSSQATRTSEVGSVWKLLLNNASTKQLVPKFSALYIKAKAACVVSLDGVQAISLDADDIIIINAGPGNPTDNKQYVTVEFTGNVICSVADEKQRSI
jgi:hypothetical protein